MWLVDRRPQVTARPPIGPHVHVCDTVTVPREVLEALVNTGHQMTSHAWLGGHVTLPEAREATRGLHAAEGYLSGRYIAVQSPPADRRAPVSFLPPARRTRANRPNQKETLSDS